MASAVADPRLALAVRERERDERGAEVVHSDRLAHLAALEQLGPLHAGKRQVSAHRVGHVPLGQRRAGVVAEHQGVVGPVALSPRLERAHHAGVESPRARVVGFVLVQPDRPVFEVEILPAERERFAQSHPLAPEHPVQHAERERHVGAAEQRAIFRRVDVRERLGQLHARQEPAGQWVRVDDARRVDRHRQQAVDGLRNVAPRRRRHALGQSAHDALRVVHPERGQGQPLHVRVHVGLEPRRVLVGARLALHVVGPALVQLTAGPLLAELPDGDRRALGRLLALRLLRQRKPVLRDERARVLLGAGPVVGCDCGAWDARLSPRPGRELVDHDPLRRAALVGPLRESPLRLGVASLGHCPGPFSARLSMWRSNVTICACTATTTESRSQSSSFATLVR